eukprot:Pgem_evm1s8977
MNPILSLCQNIITITITLIIIITSTFNYFLAESQIILLQECHCSDYFYFDLEAKLNFVRENETSYSTSRIIPKSQCEKLHDCGSLLIRNLTRKDVFKGFDNLKSLSITDCGLTSLDTEILKLLPSLLEFTISNTNLDTFDLLKIPQTLVRLDLSNNKITHLGDGAKITTNTSDLLPGGITIDVDQNGVPINFDEFHVEDDIEYKLEYLDLAKDLNLSINDFSQKLNDITFSGLTKLK